MPDETNDNKYKNGKIYCIRNTINDLIYIGSTYQKLSQRMTNHRNNSRASKNQNMKLYKAMKELGKENFYIQLLENYPCENVEQLRKRETELMLEYKADLNKNRNGRTNYERNKEYQQTHEEELKQYGKNYRETHKEEIKQKKHEDYVKHREKRLQQVKANYQANREAREERRKQHYEENKETILARKKERYEERKNEINANRREKNRLKRLESNQ